MKYIKRIELDHEQTYLIADTNIIFNEIWISGLYLNIKKLENNSYSVNYNQKNITIKNFNFEDIILKINDPYLYFNYYQNILKKPFQDSRDIISDELINAAISSIESNYNLALQYSELTKKRLRPEIEKNLLNILEEKLSNLKSVFLDRDRNIGYAYEIGNSGVYHYIRYFKRKFPEFESMLLDYSNKNGGLKITGVPYDPEIDEYTDKSYRTILDETIYNYTITNRGGTWPEIGIHNRQDLLKLRTQIVDHDTLQFRLRGYGELDY